jgi:hypothetical protein
MIDENLMMIRVCLNNVNDHDNSWFWFGQWLLYDDGYNNDNKNDCDEYDDDDDGREWDVTRLEKEMKSSQMFVTNFKGCYKCYSISL